MVCGQKEENRVGAVCVWVVAVAGLNLTETLFESILTSTCQEALPCDIATSSTATCFGRVSLHMASQHDAVMSIDLMIGQAVWVWLNGKQLATTGIGRLSTVELAEATACHATTSSIRMTTTQPLYATLGVPDNQGDEASSTDGLLSEVAGLRKWTAIHAVSLLDVLVSQVLALTKPVVRVVPHFNCLQIQRVPTEIIVAIMHDAIDVVADVVRLKVGSLCEGTGNVVSLPDVIHEDFHVIITVWSLLLMEESNGMAKLMHDNTRRGPAVTAQTDRLNTTCTANV